ncbi:MAG: hypothetical protein E6246_08905 [Veillonella sp.]|nr:hypothetical protein [Veillonella sp.]
MEINLVNEIKFVLKQNDLYFINRTQDYVIVNDDYRGVIIYTPQLDKCIYILYFSVFKSEAISLFANSLMIHWDFVDNNLSFTDIDRLSSSDELTLYRNWESELKGANSIGFIDNKWIVYEEDIEIYQDNRLVYKFPMEYSKWYRFDINGDYFIAIDESILILTSLSNTRNRLKKIYVDNESCFGAVLIHDKHFSYLVVLISNERTGASCLRSYNISN